MITAVECNVIARFQIGLWGGFFFGLHDGLLALGKCCAEFADIPSGYPIR
jgi:hypothetical protein